MHWTMGVGVYSVLAMIAATLGRAEQGGDPLREAAFEMRLIDSPSAHELGAHYLRSDMGAPPYETDPAFPSRAKAGWDHTSPYLVPFHLYAAEHPEYFAENEQGVRIATTYLHDELAPIKTLHLCMSNPEVRRIATQRLLDWIEQQKDRRFFAVTQSDGYGWCQCSECKKLDTVPGKVTSDRLLFFVNELAEAVAREYPDKILVTLAYTSFTGPPPQRIKPAPNVRVMYCPYPPETPCQGHGLECDKNEAGYAWYKAWLDWCPDQLYIYDYPVWSKVALEFTHEAQIERTRMYARDGVRGIYFCGRPLVFRELFDYVQSQLMLDASKDPEELTRQFMHQYFGDAGEPMLAIYELYKQRAADPAVHQGAAADILKFTNEELVQQAIPLFEAAQQRAQQDPVLSKRVREEKAYLLYSDLTQRNPVTGRMPQGLEVFAARLQEYISIVSDPTTDSYFGKQEEARIRSWFYRVGRLKITSQPWASDPVLVQLAKDPMGLLGSVVANRGELEPLPGGRGWNVPLALFSGGRGPQIYGYQCPPREAVWIYGAPTGENQLRARFKLDTAPPDDLKLVLEAQDQDKPEVTLIRIALNGVELFRGRNGFVKNGWSRQEYPIPAGALKAGENELLIENLEETSDYQRNWFMVAAARLESTAPIQAQAQDMPRTLFLAHFDEEMDADAAAVKQATVQGKLLVHSEGKFGKALDLKYSPESTGTIRFEGLDNYDPQRGTFEMWFKPSWSPSDQINAPLVFIYGPSSRKTGFLLQKYRNRPELMFYVYNETRQPDQGPPVSLPIPSDELKANTWYHIAFTWDGEAGVIQVFLDGVLRARRESVLLGETVADYITLGALGNERAAALIDEVRISDRVLWQAQRVGQKAFDVPTEPYADAGR